MKRIRRQTSTRRRRLNVCGGTADFGQFGGNFDVMGVIAPLFSSIVFPLQKLVEFLCHLIKGGVGILVVGVRHQVGAAHLHLGRCRIVMRLTNGLVPMEAHVDPDDLGVVAKQCGKSQLNGVLQGRREADVDALHVNF